jgi:hypothetical protein
MALDYLFELASSSIRLGPRRWASPPLPRDTWSLPALQLSSICPVPAANAGSVKERIPPTRNRCGIT